MLWFGFVKSGVIYRFLLAVLDQICGFVYLVFSLLSLSLTSFLNLHKTTDFDFWLHIAPLSIYKYQYNPTLSLQVHCLVNNSYSKTLSLLKTKYVDT